MKHLPYTILRWVSGLFLVWVLIILCPAEVLSCHIEYSDRLINVFREQGLSLNKRVGNYSGYSECEAAMRKAVEGAGDPSLASNMSCVDCNEPDDTAEKVQEARQKIIKLKKEVAGIQTLLRQCTKSLTNNSSEFDKWGIRLIRPTTVFLTTARNMFSGSF